MNTVDLFIRAVMYHLDNGATQVSIAKELGVGPQQVNAFIKGRCNFSEDRKERMSKFFNMTYLEMLNLGHELITGSKPSVPEVEIDHSTVSKKLESLYWEHDNYLIVMTTFRGKNVFGGVVKNFIKAKVDLEGNIIKVLEGF